MQSSVQILLLAMAVIAFLGVVLEEVIHVNKAKVVLLFGALSALLASFAAFWLVRFPITREDHEARLASLNATPGEALDATARADRDAHITPP